MLRVVFGVHARDYTSLNLKLLCIFHKPNVYVSGRVGRRRGPAAACLLKFLVSFSPESYMPVSHQCCLLSGNNRCVVLITRPEESYRLWCVWMWSWILDDEAVLVH